MKNSLMFLCLLALLICSCGSANKSENSGFRVMESPEGVELSENGEAVFFYQKLPKSGDGEHFFNNYLHPLYSLNGDTLTEEFPEDHFHHRGVFWAWHQLFMGDQNLGDQWMMEGIIQQVSSVENELDENSAVFNIQVSWLSSALGDNKAFMDEQTTICVHPRTDNMRIIDFEISLTALVENLKLGGSDDEKGYGGFSARLFLPDDLIFTSETGKVSPQNLQLTDGAWMDFSGSLGNNPEISGVTILCQPGTPNYPATWILRQHKSMQNIVFPGGGLVNISMDTPTVLKYRMILHKGDDPCLSCRDFVNNLHAALDGFFINGNEMMVAGRK